MKSPELLELSAEPRAEPGREAFRGLLPEGARRYLAAMDRRYACKKFDGRALEPYLEDYLLEIGRLSPSSFGLEPWRFVAIRAGGEGGGELWAALAKAALDQEAVSSAGLLIVILVHSEAAYEPDSSFIRQRSERFPGGHPVFRADYAGYYDYLAGERLLRPWARAQTYIALANMMTGAAAADIDSCAIEGYREAEILSALGEDPGLWAVGVLGAFGRRAEPVRQRIREGLGSIAEYR